MEALNLGNPPEPWALGVTDDREQYAFSYEPQSVATQLPWQTQYTNFEYPFVYDMDATLSSEAPFIVPEARAQYSFPEFTSGRTQNLPALPVSIPSQPRSAQVFPQVDTKAAMPDPGSPGLRTIVFTEAPDPLKLLLDQLEEFRSFGEDDDDDSFHPSTSATMAPFAASSRISGGTRMEDLLGSTPNDRFSPRVEVRPKRRIRRVGANSTSLACYHCRGRKIRCGGSLGAKGTPCSQCVKRNIPCSFPAFSRRGQRSNKAT